MEEADTRTCVPTHRFTSLPFYFFTFLLLSPVFFLYDMFSREFMFFYEKK